LVTKVGRESWLSVYFNPVRGKMSEKNQVPHKEQRHKVMYFNGAHDNQINEMKTSI